MDLPSLAGAEPSDLLNGSYCVGYVNGFLANLNHETGICTKAAPVGTVVRSYVAYMAQNPDLLTQDRRVGLSLALREAYPCSSQSAPPAGPAPGDRFTL